jgi:hypothetical protein
MTPLKKANRWKKAVKSGAPRGFRNLADFGDAIDAGKSPPSPLLLAIRAAFDEILDGKDANEALKLKRPTRSKAGLVDWEKPFKVIRELEALRRTGKSVKYAESVIAQKHHVSIPYIQNWRKKLQPVFDNARTIKTIRIEGR